MDAGLTAISEELSPEVTTLPTGEARWLRPATQPLNLEQQNKLDSAAAEHHASIISELQREVTPWSEMSDYDKRSFLDYWRKKWLWERDIETLMSDSSGSSMPWEVSRIIGHRGSGRTYGTG